MEEYEIGISVVPILVNLIAHPSNIYVVILPIKYYSMLRRLTPDLLLPC